VAEARRRPIDWRPHSSDTERRASPSNGDELENALAAAERVLQKVLEEDRHAQNQRVGAFSLLLTIVSVIGVLVALAESTGFGRGVGAAAAVVIAFGVPATVWLARLAARTSQRRSARFEVVSQLAAAIRDIFPEIAQREGWSYFRREATRLRLSAFPLNPDRTSAPVQSVPEQRRS
jgi:hypothetical protein